MVTPASGIFSVNPNYSWRLLLQLSIVCHHKPCSFLALRRTAIRSAERVTTLDWTWRKLAGCATTPHE